MLIKSQHDNAIEITRLVAYYNVDSKINMQAILMTSTS